MTTRVLVAGAALSILLSCSATPAKTCMSDADCAIGLKCENAACVTPLASTECTAGQSRPCGPEPVGACRKGLQICVDGVFETDCRFAVNPLPEQCNAIDDDCDGVVDNGVMQAFYPDVDGDGFGSNAAGVSQTACVKPAGFVTSNTDCDDSAASVSPGATERCEAAGVDEDCDGTANEGCACSTPGMSQACCAGRGTQTCDAINGGTMLSMCSVMPSLETCNAIDDDCNGQVDDQYALVTPDGGALIIDGGVLELDGGCAVGVGACARSGSSTCVGGVLGCSVVAGTPGNETCNGLDDDCDGQTDNAANLCSIAGQSCTNGTCACPSGESVCGASCQSLGASCSDGVGSCRRQGAMACINNAVACDAVPGMPVAEACDGADNDCDGTVDNGVTVTCAHDADNDLYADDNTASQQCPDSSRPGFGTCPAGFIALSHSQGTDCDPTNGNVYRLVATRADADGDTRCAGAAVDSCVGTFAPTGRRFSTDCVSDDCDDTDASKFQLLTGRADFDDDTYCVASVMLACVGASLPAGYRTPSSCAATNDCNDIDAALYRLVSVRNDADNDGYCVGTASNGCIGAAPPAGRREAINCQAADDCNDNSGSVYRLVSSRSDADNDGYCVGTSGNDCVGTNALAGRRFAATCSTVNDDCNDANASAFRIVNVRTDADGDTWCTGAVVAQCTGASPLPGTRLTSSCAGDDCSDTNAFATSTCSIVGGYNTVFHYKACGIGLPASETFFVSTTTICPSGFAVANLRTEKSSGNGTCAAIDANTLQQSCTAFDNSTCRIVGDCNSL